MHKQNRYGAWSSQPIEFRLEGTQLVYKKKSKERRLDLCAGDKGCQVEHMPAIIKPPGKFTEAYGFTLHDLPVPAGSHNKVRDSINLCCQLKVERQEWVSFIRRVVNVATQKIRLAPKKAQNAASLKEQWAKRG